MAKKKQVKKQQTRRKAHSLEANKVKAFSVENKDLFDQKKSPGLKLGAKDILRNPKIAKHEISDAEVSTMVSAAISRDDEKTPKRVPLTVGECKLGLTIVLPMEDLKALGVESSWTRRQAHALVREKLGLQAKKKEASA